MGWHPVDIVDISRKMTATLKTIKYLTQDELRRLFAVITSKRDRAMFVLAYRHGLRASEVGMIQTTDIDLDRQRIRINRLKGSSGGEYLMDPGEVKAVKAWLKERGKNESPHVFTTRTRTPVSRWTLDDLMKKYGAKAGLPEDKRHFHVLKHSIATHMLDGGADLRFVQDWIGHKNIQNTVVYAAISNPARDAQAKKLFANPAIVSV